MSVDADVLQTAAPEPEQSVRLTDMERRVFDRVLPGENAREISERLGNAEKTVKAHLTSILKKYGADSRARLISKHYRGLLS